jgi:hypothetical protein
MQVVTYIENKTNLSYEQNKKMAATNGSASISNMMLSVSITVSTFDEDDDDDDDEEEEEL